MQDMTDVLSSAEMIAEAGITYRQADWWTRKGYLRPLTSGGSGNPRVWTLSEVAVARCMADLIRAGLTPSGAASVARKGWPGGTAPASGWHPAMTEEWQSHALCAETDPDAFFPEKGASTRAAKDVCHACEVRPACLDYAIEHDIRFGIWGGLTTRSRDRLAAHLAKEAS